ncbi:MAG: hypothetical protein V4487_02025, partial [Chlamydiota bacterium]
MQKRFWENCGITKKNRFSDRPFGSPIGTWVQASSAALFDQTFWLQPLFESTALQDCEEILFIKISELLNK